MEMENGKQVASAFFLQLREMLERSVGDSVLLTVLRLVSAWVMHSLVLRVQGRQIEYLKREVEVLKSIVSKSDTQKPQQQSPLEPK